MGARGDVGGLSIVGTALVATLYGMRDPQLIPKAVPVSLFSAVVVCAALDRGVRLGGEIRDVGVLFVDVVGSTTMATRLPPHEVVETLNRFFGVVVSAVNRRGGLINKFEGDAALAVFGAPAPHPDPAGAALEAAAEIARELAAADLGIEAGVGVSYGEVVAGNIRCRTFLERGRRRGPARAVDPDSAVPARGVTRAPASAERATTRSARRTIFALFAKLCKQQAGGRHRHRPPLEGSG
ncbi:adenylate/guanylate cyclase domain-containing protein [Nocardia jiangxiensis]|uniref:Adenylate/guanylate cyclase domain-containing protein n=1 Tax=Nocardia jiangxiensis TaxID=282685 RepID=A0ABW6RVC4_9NOCA